MHLLQKTLGKLVNSIQPYNLKMVLIVRTDLKMEKGKIASQCAHAAVICYQQALEASSGQQELARKWYNFGQPKIVLKVDSEDALRQLYQVALDEKLNAAYVQDAGHTQVECGTMTVLGIGPNDRPLVDKVFSVIEKLLRLYLTFKNSVIMESPSNWNDEANAVIRDVQNHVRKIELSQLDNSEKYIYLNIITLEEKRYCIEMSGNGFRIVGNRHNSQEEPSEEYFETPYSLLSTISENFSKSFGNELMDKLSKLPSD